MQRAMCPALPEIPSCKERESSALMVTPETVSKRTVSGSPSGRRRRWGGWTSLGPALRPLTGIGMCSQSRAVGKRRMTQPAVLSLPGSVVHGPRLVPVGHLNNHWQQQIHEAGLDRDKESLEAEADREASPCGGTGCAGWAAVWQRWSISSCVARVRRPCSHASRPP